MPTASVKKFFEYYQLSFLEIWHELFGEYAIKDKDEHLQYLSKKLKHRIILSAPIVTLLIILKISLYFFYLSNAKWFSILVINFLFTDTTLLAMLIISVFTKSPNAKYYNNMLILASLSLFSCILNYAYTATQAIYYPNEILGLGILLFLWIFNYPLKWVIAAPLLTLISYFVVFFALDQHINHEKETSMILLTFTFFIGLFYSIMNGANEYRLFKSFKNAEAQALTDSLTNMYNRKGFLKKFELINKIAKRENKRIYIAILDIDNFKKINDHYGHDIGDNVITMVASKISELYRRPLDLTARWGGEEFIISWCEENSETIATAGHRICQTIANSVFNQMENIRVTVSVGIALINDDDSSLTDTLKRADIALYTAKNNGKNQFIVA